MRYLLDTHTLLWFLQDDPALPETVAARMESETSDLYLSAVSIWEMAIKISLNRLHVAYDLNDGLTNLLRKVGIAVLPPDGADYDALASRPFHHRDPFDRMIAVQALNRRLTLLSRDPVFDAYGVKRLWN